MCVGGKVVKVKEARIVKSRHPVSSTSQALVAVAFVRFVFPLALMGHGTALLILLASQ